jgi:hypothetical protein
MSDDEACGLEPLEVHVEERAADREVAGELADVVAAGGEGGDDAQAVRIRERGEHPEHVVSRCLDGVDGRWLLYLSEDTDM